MIWTLDNINDFNNPDCDIECNKQYNKDKNITYILLLLEFNNIYYKKGYEFNQQKKGSNSHDKKPLNNYKILNIFKFDGRNEKSVLFHQL